MNRFIIRQLESNKLSFFKLGGDALSLLFVIALFSLGPMYFLGKVIPPYLTISLVLIGVFVISEVLYYVPEESNFGAGVATLLHNLLPGKEARTNEINTFRVQAEQNNARNFYRNRQPAPRNIYEAEVEGFGRHIAEEQERNRQAWAAERTRSLLQMEMLRDDIDLFLKTYVQFTSPFKKFFVERMFSEKQLNESKLRMLLSIPRIKTMPIDFLREIILSLNHVKFDNPFSLINSPQAKVWFHTFVESGILDDYFKDFTDEQIRLVFTREYSASGYMNLIYTLQGKGVVTPLKVSNNMPELIFQNDPEKKELRHNYLELLPSIKHDHFKFRLVRSRSEYAWTGQHFSNCVRGMFEPNSLSDIFTVSTHNGDPVACVEYRLSRIVQIAGYGNTQVSRSVVDFVNKSLRDAQGYGNGSV